MVLLYKNFTTNHVLEQSRNIGFTLGNMVHSFNNTIESNYNVVLDEQQLFIQADVLLDKYCCIDQFLILKDFLVLTKMTGTDYLWKHMSTTD
jgi:hypothetical protein